MALKNIQWRSLKTRVTLFSLAIFLLSIWSLEFYANQMLRESMQRTMGQQQFSSVSILAEQVNQELSERLSALEKIAASITPALLDNPSALQDTLALQLIPQELFNLGIYATGLDGVAIADAPLSMARIGINYADRDYIIGALKQGKATISRPVLGKKSHAPVIVIGVPIRDTQGKVIGALAGVTDLGQNNFLDHITRNHYGKTGYFLIEEPKGRLVVTASDKSRIMQPLPAPGVNRLIDRFLQGHEETGITHNQNGVEVLASSKRIPVANWIIIAALPIAEAFAPIHDMQQRMWLATLLLTLLAGGLTWWMLRRQLSPMLATVNMLAALSEANQPPQALPVTSRDEIGQLIGGFNRLLDTLAQREAALRESEHKLSVILESVDAYIYLKDIQGRYLFANRPVRELFGVSMEELVGYGDDRFFDAETVAKLRSNDRQVLQQGKTFKAEETNLNLRDGRTSTYLSVKLPLYNDAGEIYALCGISTDITERKQVEDALASKSALLEAQLNATIDGVLVVDQDRKKILHNHRLNELFDIPEHLQSTEDDAAQLEYVVGISKDPDNFLKKVMYLYAHPSESSTDEVALKNGKILERFSAPIVGKNGQNYGRIWTFHDITARKHAEEKLHLAASVFSHSREGIMITAPDGTILDVNDAFYRITGYSRDEALGRNPRILNSGRQGKDYYAAMWCSLIDKGHWYGEVWNRRKSGEVYAEMQTISTVYDDNGAPQCYVALFSDTTSQKEHQSQLEHIAHYDALTGLPNRLLLADRLHQSMAQAQRRGQLLAVAYLDLDGFKAINDNHGHEAGDQLLIAVATRMQDTLREGDTLARLGGDEFVAVLIDLADTAACVPLLSRLLAAAAQPVEFDSLWLQVSASLGITFYPQGNEVDADQLLRQADQAMYQAKLAGKNRYHVFAAEQNGMI